MEPLHKLLRFLHLGTSDAYYFPSKKLRSIENAEVQLGFLKTEGADDIWPFVSIRKAFLNKSLPRNNEAIFVLAYCCRKINNEKLRQAIYKGLPEILIPCHDLFLFIKYYYEFGGEKGFGRGIKNAIKNWYDKKTALELADAIGKRRVYHCWSHKDVIHMAHVHLDDIDKQKILDATFQRGVKVLKKESKEEEQTEGLRRLKDAFRLKICEKSKDAADMITSYKFSIEHCPNHLKHFPEVWEAALPTMTFTDLLYYIPILNDLKLIKQNTAFSKKFAHALANANLITESKVYPIQIFVVLRSYETETRYSEYVKNHHHNRQSSKHNIDANPKIVKSLQTALNLSFNFFPRVGVRYFITIDVRTANFQKPILGERHLSCMEVSILYALSILKREKDVVVMTYTKDPDVLKPVGFTKDMTYEKAFSLCESIQEKHTHRSLLTPINYAQKQKKKYDMFVTMVNSVAHFCQQGTSPITLLTEYKQSTKAKFAKYVAINLSRPTQDINRCPFAKGVLEINGFNVTTPKIIESFGKNQFM